MRGIRVWGTGRVERSPDIATVTLGAEVEAAGAAEAQSLAGERMRGVLAALDEQELAERDVATSRISLEQTFDYSDAAPRPTGYQATQSVTVRVRDLSRLGAVVDAALGAGANRVADVALGIDDPAEARWEAGALAVADAKRAAQALAEAAGVRLGLPIAIREEAGGRAPGPVRFRMAEAAMVDGTPVAPGRTTVEVTVLVTYALLG
jgi:uncharacterized protein YggE